MRGSRSSATVRAGHNILTLTLFLQGAYSNVRYLTLGGGTSTTISNPNDISHFVSKLILLYVAAFVL